MEDSLECGTRLARGDAPRHLLSQPPLAKLSARRVHVVAARFADVGDDAGLAEDRQERAHALGRRADVGDAGQAGADGVVGDEVDVSAEAVQQIVTIRPVRSWKRLAAATTSATA